VSWKRELLDTGETVEAFGKVPHGFLSYGRDGRVFFMFDRRRLNMSTDPQLGFDGKRVVGVFTWKKLA
jgi:hypothetical protein